MLFRSIENSVHVFDPERVDRAVKYSPCCASVLDSFANDLGSKSIRPFFCVSVFLAVKFAHRDRLGVQDLDFDLIIYDSVLLVECRDSVLQNLEAS